MDAWTRPALQRVRLDGAAGAALRRLRALSRAARDNLRERRSHADSAGCPNRSRLTGHATRPVPVGARDLPQTREREPDRVAQGSLSRRDLGTRPSRRRPGNCHGLDRQPRRVVRGARRPGRPAVCRVCDRRASARSQRSDRRLWRGRPACRRGRAAREGTRVDSGGLDACDFERSRAQRRGQPVRPRRLRGDRRRDRSRSLDSSPRLSACRSRAAICSPASLAGSAATHRPGDRRLSLPVSRLPPRRSRRRSPQEVPSRLPGTSRSRAPHQMPHRAGSRSRRCRTTAPS